jgi:peptidoglycan hydrolase-like protein with peptidoglycan-binding domain
VAVDGIFGPQTEAAVKSFQQSNGLAADGIVGPLTWPKLIVQVKKGSSGDAVRGVQEVMRFHDQSGGEGPPILVDGIFGPQTDHWVRGFQNAVDIDVDGIVGPITWRAMVSGMLSGSRPGARSCGRSSSLRTGQTTWTFPVALNEPDRLIS